MNEIQLQDIIINFCRIRSSISEGFHIFKGRLREIKGTDTSLDEKVKLLTNEFIKFEKDLTRDVGKYPEIITEYSRVISQFNANDIDSIDLILSENEETFSKFLPLWHYLDNKYKPALHHKLYTVTSFIISFIYSGNSKGMCARC